MELTFNGNEPEEIKYNNNNVAHVVYNGNDVWFQKFEYTQSSTSFPVTLAKTLPFNLLDYKIYGETTRDGTPTKTNPKELECVGNKVTDVNDAHYGEYVIPITATDSNNVTITTNIYLDEPLCRFGYCQ